MPEPNVEGTFVLEGLLEGSPASLSDQTEALQAWAQRARDLGFPFSLQVDTGSFNILAEPRPIILRELRDGASNPSAAVAAALTALLELFPPDQRRSLLSTIHSREYRRNLEVQTLYAIGPDGAIHTREQVVETQTVAPLEPLTRSQKIRVGVIAGVIVLVLLAVTGGLLWHFGVLGRVAESITPLDVENLSVDWGGLDRYFQVKSIERDSTSRVRYLVVTVQRTDAWPLSPAAANALLNDPDMSSLAKLQAQAIVRGYAHVEMFREGKLLTWAEVRLPDLAQADEGKLLIPLPGDRNPDHIVLRP